MVTKNSELTAMVGMPGIVAGRMMRRKQIAKEESPLLDMVGEEVALTDTEEIGEGRDL